MVLDKLIAQNMLFLDYLSHGKKALDNSGYVGTMLMDLSKLMTVFLMIY